MAAAISLLFLFLIFFTLTAAQQTSSKISLGSSLSPTTNSSWLSPSGQFAFGFYQYANGYAVGIWFAKIPTKTVIWTANRDDPPLQQDSRLVLTRDGRLILQTTASQSTSIAEAAQSASWASMLDTGNFVLCNSSGNIIWQSFDFPTDTILPGQPLLVEGKLVSSTSETNHSSGWFYIIMQSDGNLVQYPMQNAKAETSYYASDTCCRRDNVTLNFTDDGALNLYNTTGINIKNLYNGGVQCRTNGFISCRWTMDVDGIFRLYVLGQSGNWSTSVHLNPRSCPTGMCGLNGYCVVMDQQYTCRCIPGLDFIDQSQQILGCQRINGTDSCRNSKQHPQFTMSTLNNVQWEDNGYELLPSKTEEDCIQACWQDCNCGVALFWDQRCSKQKLPLRYGRRNDNDQTKTFIKMVIGSGPSGTQMNTNSMEAGSKPKELRKDILFIIIAITGCALLVVALFAIFVQRNRFRSYRKMMTDRGIRNFNDEDITLRSFTYAELERVTAGFNQELGKGACGTVFKGVLPNGQDAAVKRLHKVIDEGEQEFRTEMRVIGRTHHRNLVRLLGYCNEGLNRLLVYEYMSNGSLADFLFKSETQPTWDERVGIALNIAKGILYLHEECETQIIHCDIKPQNILMGHHQCPKIADFGLARLLKQDQTGILTGIKGTRGYVAPEWHRINVPITAKVDVYSFGVVLLEIICCRRSVDVNLPEGQVVLVDWVYDCFEAGEVGKLVGDEVIDKKLERMIWLGLWCIQDEPSIRPSMKKVVMVLEGNAEVAVPPGPSLSNIYEYGNK
ncbi:PREDICTED: G-type lectin S-receptor-like serine/threonine-protein kinase LECRK1 [Nelumbo nucifera]|uniref:Receptor-like serine/threonine-protein kinase n=2 Tax=Nelumbo nucifera TaxID=4432 RepID=A0A822XSB3_NELNU|nr:PREDICTED: G-type lectin S-receptor-like serine/threonine-protein kinase LECRK1 [Nelumbo nucifera]DAD22583.1 TPA_asm: hypothetical protein HUJ06_024046 [Nelumbo nucifera]